VTHLFFVCLALLNIPDRNEYDVINGTEFAISCTAWGFPRPNIEWVKDGDVITSSQTSSNLTSITRILTISNVSSYCYCKSSIKIQLLYLQLNNKHKYCLL